MSEQRINEPLSDVLERREVAPSYTLWFDGSCEPVNPGGVATCGWIMKADNGRIVAQGHREVCRGHAATNNVAEYYALGLALRHCLDNQEQFCGCVLRIQGDSKLVIEQLNGTWKCNKEHLQKLRDRCLSILSELGAASWTAQWIPREQNDEADALSQRAYVEATGLAYPRRRA